MMSTVSMPYERYRKAEKALAENADLRARLAAAERKRDEWRTTSEAVGAGIKGMHDQIAAQSAALAYAREALKVGRAWSEEYLVECEDQPLEAERVRWGLATIDAALTTISALKGTPT